MWFWWFMFLFNLVTPSIMILGGWMMWKHTPKKINGFIGYRTSRSMKTIDTWNFAHCCCGKLWWRLGWILLAPSMIVSLPFYGSSDDAIGAVGVLLASIQIAVLLFSIFPTEAALKRTFGEDGTRKRIP